ncbi:ribulokinase [Persicobacter diffluens]|uniref:Ribulokinase n=1 Tax=Persicobacter diffluens TaxID=981 RepID=A0AAN4W2L8_9BACT|nr:ribulokinase [Persicobacter diffluens]
MSANQKKYVIGMDYGSDSCRALLVDTSNGEEVATSVHYYQRWKEGKYCNASANQFRQHPLDYLEGLEKTIKEVLAQAPNVDPQSVEAISVDTTGSTPVAVNEQGIPLALVPGFEENPNAMFLLWKDHTAVQEADEINHLAKTWGGVDFTKYEGGTYSSEWFWSKILHVIREDQEVAQAAHSWLEHCDWIPYVLTGASTLADFKRSRCAAGHKAMWHPDWNGLPEKAFLSQLDVRLAELRDRLFEATYTADDVAGSLCPEWAEKLGLSTDVKIGVGTFDAHSGAVGGAITANTLVKVMGTSTCDMVVGSYEEVGDKCVRGICGQVDGSILPGMVGLEAGQSGFGDVLAWFKNVLAWPMRQSGASEADIDAIIPNLTAAAEKLAVEDGQVVALDWVNGRRTPDANQLLKGAIQGLSMGTDAPRLFKAMVEAICFGSKAIVDRFESEGVPVNAVVGMGGVAKKSRFVMQTLADILNKPIQVVTSHQAPALGAAMYAAVVGGVYASVGEAMEHMSSGFDKVYQPIPSNVEFYQQQYERYYALGQFVESSIKTENEQVSSVEAGVL